MCSADRLREEPPSIVGREGLSQEPKDLRAREETHWAEESKCSHLELLRISVGCRRDDRVTTA